MFDFRKLVVKYLRDTVEKIECGNTDLTESEAMDILRVIAHESLSKEQACAFFNDYSRSRFDDLVREGIIPRGRKIAGHKELRWYKDDLEIALYKMRKMKKNLVR